MTPALARSLNLQSFTLLVVAGILVTLVITPADAISGLDLIAYVSSFDLFCHGGNPYSLDELFRKQQEWRVQRDAPVAMWNPPIYFFYFAPIISLPPNLAPIFSREISFVCALTLALLGWRLADAKRAPIPLNQFIICAFGLLPFWEEIKLAQNSTWVSLYVATGTFLFLRGRWMYIAGALLAVALCKPHDFYIPLCIISFQVIRTRRWKIVIGATLSLLIAASVVQAIQPGIWSKWIFRDLWPFEAYGANLTAVFRVLAQDGRIIPNTILALVSSIIGLFVWWRGLVFCRFNTINDTLMWGWIVTPFFAPYGFLSDQVTLIFPVAYFLSRINNEDSLTPQKKCISLCVLLTLTCFVLGLFPASPVPISWLLFAPGVMALVCYSFFETKRVE